MGFAVRAIQVDGGSEFMAQFEVACRERGIRLFVLPPRFKEEFYRYADLSLSLTGINKALRTWERVHNCIRPHQALGYLTPKAFYQRHLALERS